MTSTCFMASMNEDLLHNILYRLPAKSFAFASCVCRPWSNVCCRILSRPKICSAFSFGPNQRKAAEEALDKILSKPIRPDFVFANVTGDASLVEMMRLIVERVGSKVPIIVSLAPGILKNEAYSNTFKELKRNYSIDENTLTDFDGVNSAILLTTGTLPGLKVEVIPIVKADEESEDTLGDKFVMDIGEYVSSVSDHPAPVCAILLGGDHHNIEPLIEKLDCAMPRETIFLGGERCHFVYKKANGSRNFELGKSSCGTILAGLIFARDRHKPSYTGEIQFHTAISRGVSSVGLRYKVASVRSIFPVAVTILTAKREGQAEVLDGEQLLDDINNLLDNDTKNANLYIGVTKRRNHSAGSEESKPITSLVFHEVTGGDEQFLTVDGAGIRTGDDFQFYYFDPKAMKASVSVVSSELRNVKMRSKGKREFIGGFIFTCCGRKESLSGYPNIDSSPFLENFSDLPFGGIYCGGEILRSSNEHCVQQCRHVYSAVYLLASYNT